MKKRSLGLVVIGLLVTAALLGALSQSGEDLFQKALRLERNEGKLIEAVKLYDKVVAEKGNEGLSAQAQLRIGFCYEKLGQKSIKQAQDAFQKVIDNYPLQSEEVRVAREKLNFLMKAQSPAAGKPPESCHRTPARRSPRAQPTARHPVGRICAGAGSSRPSGRRPCLWAQ